MFFSSTVDPSADADANALSARAAFRNAPTQRYMLFVKRFDMREQSAKNDLSDYDVVCVSVREGRIQYNGCRLDCQNASTCNKNIVKQTEQVCFRFPHNLPQSIVFASQYAFYQLGSFMFSLDPFIAICLTM